MTATVLALLATAAVGADASSHLYEQAIAKGDFDQAAVAARALITAASDQFGPRSAQVGLGYVKLAHAERRLGDLRAATEGYAIAAKLIESAYSPTHHALFEPLAGLGESLAALDRHRDALEVLDRAVTISRRSQGLFNLEQLPALETMSDLLSRDGRLDRAEITLRYAVRIYEQQYGAKDPRTALALALLAHWFARTGNYLESRRLYRDSIRMIEQEAGRNSPSLITPLAGLADSYRRERLGLKDFEARASEVSLADETAVRTREDLLNVGAYNYSSMIKLHPAGLRDLERAIEIAETHADALEPGVARALYLQRGDWQQLGGQSEAALASYRRTFEMPRATPGEPAPDEFGFPVPLYIPLPAAAARHGNLPDDAVQESYAVLEFSVTAAGAVSEVRLAESDTSDVNAASALKAMRLAIYRPRFEDGEPVATSGVRYRMVFRVRR